MNDELNRNELSHQTGALEVEFFLDSAIEILFERGDLLGAARAKRFQARLAGAPNLAHAFELCLNTLDLDDVAIGTEILGVVTDLFATEN